jgi:hypothetical protein
VAAHRPADAAPGTFPSLAHVAVSALTSWGAPKLEEVVAAASLRRPGRQLAVLFKAEWTDLKTRYKHLQHAAAAAVAQEAAEDAAAAAVTATATDTDFERGVLLRVGAMPNAATKNSIRV